MVNFVVAQDTIPDCSSHKEMKEMVMGWEYEEHCLVDGELPDKLAKNGTSDGLIITVQSKVDLGYSKHWRMEYLIGKICATIYMLLVYAG
jgi:hypothetical protein